MKTVLKNILFLSLSLMIAPIASSQTTVCLGDDATICKGENVQIQDCNPGGGSESGGIILNNPSTVSLSDDSFSGNIPIGFPFSFYGNTYNECKIGSNGMISFNLNIGTYNSWSLNGTPLPNTTPADAMNAAMICYQDINPGQGGSIMYQTIGTAPNRMFVVIYSNIPMFSSQECSYQASVFYETTNIIEFYIGHKPVSSWNSGRAIQGIQNANGTVASIVPGRNNTSFTLTNDAQRFTPTSPTNTANYTINQIPYVPIIGNGGNFIWRSTLGQSFPYNNGVLNINNHPAGTRGYFLTLSGTSCNSQMGGVSDTTWITGLVTTATATSVSDICSAGMGSVTAVPGQGDAPFTYNWPGLGNATTQTVENVSSGTYQVQVTDANGCTGTANVVVGDIPATYTSSSTLVSCPGGNDGTATVAMEPSLGTVTYQWNDPAQQTTATAVGLTAGTYECVITSDVGCTNTVEVVVDEIPGMQLTIVNQVDVTCNSGADGIVQVEIEEGSAPYSYSWSGSNSTNALANDLEFGTHTLTVTDNKACVITEDVIIGQPEALKITQISQDTIICIDDPVNLFVVGEGGSSPYTFTWESNGQVDAVGNMVTVTPVAGITEYCVTMSEACGSPVDTKCVTVSYPEEVVISLLPDITADCFPVEVNFDNTTNTLETIDYTIWNYTDGDSDTVAGANAVSHEFGEGVWGVHMTVVTDRGCVYTQNYPGLIEGYSYPVPDFYANPNPASVFDPRVTAYSQSSNDIVSYKWNAEGAKPAYSSLQNPTFTYPNEIRNYPLTLIVENEFGCIDSITKIIRIENEVLLFAPNSFTPDTDGFNDKWRVHIEGIDKYNFHLQLYNRWGELIFESFDPEGEWDGTYGGTPVQAGTYVWKIEANDYENDNKYEFNGFVNLLK